MNAHFAPSLIGLLALVLAGGCSSPSAHPSTGMPLGGATSLAGSGSSQGGSANSA
jgi:hypothetical protein